MFINFIDSNGGNVEELEQQISALTEELNTVSEDFADVVDRSVETLTIPDGVSTIGENAFASCSALTEVVIHSGVTSIEANAFADNTSLETITFEGDTPPTVASGAFSKLPADVEVVVPSGATDAYSAVTENIEESTAAVIYFYSGNTVLSYSPSGKTIDYQDEALQPYLAHTYDKIETVGVENLGANCFLWTVCPEYYFDEKLTKNECTPFWHDAKKIVFSATTLDYSNFDARLFSSAGGGIACSSLTFCCMECPTMNIEYYDTSVSLPAGTLYVPEGSKGWDKLISSGLTSAWTVYDVANSAHTLGSIVYTTSASTESDWFYETPGNAKYVFHNEILSAKIDNCRYSGGQTFQGCTNMSAITIGTQSNGNPITIEGNFCYGCTNLAQITMYGYTIHTDASDWFYGVSSTGELRVDTNNPNYNADNWMTYKNSLGLSGWTLCDLSGNTITISKFEPLQDYAQLSSKNFTFAKVLNSNTTAMGIDLDGLGAMWYNPEGGVSVNGTVIVPTYDSNQNKVVYINQSTGTECTAVQKAEFEQYLEVYSDTDYDGTVMIVTEIKGTLVVQPAWATNPICGQWTDWYVYK